MDYRGAPAVAVLLGHVYTLEITKLFYSYIRVLGKGRRDYHSRPSRLFSSYPKEAKQLLNGC